jgi:stearoyl-CoA desaturase (delta-9 desaturase)
MLNGLSNASPWELVFLGLFVTHVTIASVTIFLHRHQAHKALTLHPVASHFFRFWLWLTTGMITKEWVSVHRKHHAKCETAQDPHSPQVFGVRKVLLEGAELYCKTAEDPATLEKYGSGTPDDWLERRLYSRHSHLGLGIMLVADVLLFGAFGLTLWAVQMLWIPFWAAGVINGVGHYAGYRNFETRDASANISPLGILIGGEELHNNHHAYPASAKLSSRWWEFDIGWFYIRILERLHLARVRRIAPKSRIERDKALIDRQTVLAVVQNRFHVMALFGRKVVAPVLRTEAKRADANTRKLLRQAQPLMVREFLRMDESHILTKALETSQALATVYQFREQLREIWTNASISQEKRLDALREWCRQAEESSIWYLQNFAAVLRGYSVLPPAPA